MLLGECRMQNGFSIKWIFKGFWLGGLVAFLLVLGVAESIAELLQRNQVERQRIAVLNHTATLRARLEGEINSSLHLTRGLIANVAIKPEVKTEEFDALASEIIAVGRNIRNIGLARNNVITHIYPLAGNEAALGLDYASQLDQWPAIREAMDKRGTVVAGPVNLVQGGEAFIARMPVYTRGGSGGHLSQHKPTYWGMASIVIDIPSLFASAGVKPQVDGLRIALRGKDGMGAEGDMIFGDPAVFSSDPVTLLVLLPNGSWQLGAWPLGGWRGDDGMVWPLRVGGWLTAVAIGLLIGMLLRAREVNKSLALHDHLTELPNRRLLEDRFEQTIARSLRNNTGFGVLYIDLDGFKAVNDQYGHRVGDGLLIEVAKRLLAATRKVDTVARIGGDEFIVLFDGVNSTDDMQRLCETLKSDLRGNAYVEGHRLELQASMGGALYPDDGKDIDELLRSADREMYKQKHGGQVYQMDFSKH
jgi:diguanylate cyclase (GGDEF)-like protein